MWGCTALLSRHAPYKEIEYQCYALSFTYLYSNLAVDLCSQPPTFVFINFHRTHMDSHSYCISTSPGILVAMVNTTVGVGLAKDQPLTPTFAPLMEKAKSSLESESPYLSTARLRSPSTISSSSGSSSGSSSVSDEEVQQWDCAAPFYANIDQAYLCIQQAYLNVQRACNGRKVM